MRVFFDTSAFVKRYVLRTALKKTLRPELIEAGTGSNNEETTSIRIKFEPHMKYSCISLSIHLLGRCPTMRWAAVLCQTLLMDK